MPYLHGSAVVATTLVASPGALTVIRSNVRRLTDRVRFTRRGR